MECFTNFEFVDLIGFAKIIGTDPALTRRVVISSAAMSKSNEKDWEDLVCGIVEEFGKKDRKTRREILKLAKEISAGNLANSQKEDQN